ncbi:MFS transporter [Streptomyces sp. NPDC059092]|uniref:MFS transporter n=1 Tax=Streptomyces sp. NPDC059092 TaxID=3346725 RepID=UPI0036997865
MKQRYALRVYVGGATAARTGDEMSGPALLLAALAATGSAATASTLLAGVMISAAVGGPLFGVLLDRSAAPGRLLGGALALYAAGLGVILVLLGLSRVPVHLAVLVAVVAGLLSPALSGGWTSQLPRLVPLEGLRRATAFDAMTFNLASLTGPALAGAVAGLYGARVGVIVSTGLICAALPSALALPSPASSPVPRTSLVPVAVGLGTELAAGFRALVRARPLARATAASVVSGVGRGMLIACCPLLGERAFGAADRGALLLAVVAASALVANAALTRAASLQGLAPDTVLWLGSATASLGLLLAATGRPALVPAALVLVGIGEGPQLTALFAIRHREAPDRLRGQIFTTGASLKITGFAVGAALTGPVAAWSLPGALLTAAGCEALAVAVCAAFRLREARLRRP